MVYPFRDENALKVNNIYCQKLVEEGVLHTIRENKRFFDPNCEEIINAFVRNKIRNKISDVDFSVDYDDNYLNDFKHQNCLTKKKVNSVNVFISGGAGVGKSYLINIIFQALTETFNPYSCTPEKVKVLKMAPTGVAVVNINGTTINTALGIPTTRGNNIPKLSNKMRCKLRLMYSELEAVTIDEISMISHIRQYQIHCRLCEIFNFSLDIPFAGLTVILLGDLYQLRLVQGKKVFGPVHYDLLNLFHPWEHFSSF